MTAATSNKELLLGKRPSSPGLLSF